MDQPTFVDRIRSHKVWGAWWKAKRLVGDMTSPLSDRFRQDRWWPVLAGIGAGFLSLAHFEFDEAYFVAMAQVIPVLLVAMLVELALFHRIYMAVVPQTFERPPDPRRAAFYTFKIWVRALLRLALLGLAGCLLALALDTQGAFLGWLAGIAAAGVAVSLVKALEQRLEFYELLKRRTPGPPPEI